MLGKRYNSLIIQRKNLEYLFKAISEYTLIEIESTEISFSLAAISHITSAVAYLPRPISSLYPFPTFHSVNNRYNLSPL